MAEAAGAATEVWVVLVDPEGVDREIGIQVDPAIAGPELLAALCSHVGVDPASSVLLSDRLRTRLDELDDATSNLRMGDRLLLHDEAVPPPWPRDAADAVVDLVVVGGPLQGIRVPLSQGEHLVGRGSGSDVKLDDAALSRRHLNIIVDRDSLAVEDAGSSNGTFVEGERVEGRREITQTSVVEAGASLISLRPPAPPSPPSDVPPGVTIALNRPPRIMARRSELRIDLGSPPEEPSSPRLPLAASLVPLAIGIALVLLFPFNPGMLLFFAVTPIMALWSVIAERRSGRKEFRQKAEDYSRKIAAETERIQADLEREKEIRRESAPDASSLAGMVRTHDPRVWERRPADPDFLEFRIGFGDEPAPITLDLGEGGSPELRAEAERSISGSRVLSSVPTTFSLRDAGVVGISGPADDVHALARWIAMQAGVLHSPRDLALAAIVPEGGTDRWSWVKWIPHAAHEAGPVGTGHIAAGEAPTRTLVARLQAIVDERTARSRGFDPATEAEPSIVVFVDQAASPPPVEIQRLLESGPRAGVFAVWAGSATSELPGACSAIVEVDRDADRVRLIRAAEGTTVERSGVEGLDAHLTRELCLMLAPLRDATHRGPSSGLPERAPLLDLLGLADVSPEVVSAHRRETGELVAPIGRTERGPFEIDLRSDGPHCLIGGTTGAGKSELLQTLIASFAAHFPTDRINMILIDYKGGTAFKDCVNLPHVVGSVTDLDDGLALRALTSLDAELRRREAILRDAGARDLAEMERKDPDGAPPVLLIVIDEFAALVRELPEFVEGVVDIAQRGRGLGIHLVLATQRPAGVVTDAIRANTNLRIALRVADASDSTDVIGTPDAAHIPRSIPGRAFARKAHSEVVAFQTAFGGYAPQRPVARGPRVFDLTIAGAPRAPGDAGLDGATQLQMLVDAIAAAHENSAGRRPLRPWAPPLPQIVELDGLSGSDAPRGRVAIGLGDEPEAQRQDPFLLDLDDVGSVIVYGGGGSGKTTLLRTIAGALAAGASPDDVTIHAVDFAARGLQSIEPLPHCGSVIRGDDQERVQRLFSMLVDEIAVRNESFAAKRATSLREYGFLGGRMSRIVVLFDGYASFAASFEKVDFGELLDLLPRVISEGRQLGIHLVVTAERRGAVSAALAGAAGMKITMRMADTDEYAALGLDPRMMKGTHMPPGRAYVDARTQFQCAIAGRDPSGRGQAEALAAIARSAGERYPGVRAREIEVLTARVDRSDLPPTEAPLLAAIGRDEDLRPAVVDLRDGHFVVAGPYKSGRSTALETIALGLDATDLRLLAPRRTPLTATTATTAFTMVASGSDECAAAIRRLADEVPARGESSDPLVIVVDDADELIESAEAYGLEQAMRTGRDRNVRFVVAAESHALHRAFGGFVAEVRKDKHGLLLAPDVEIDGDLLGTRLPRRTKMTFPTGRGYLVRRGAVDLVQVAAG